MLVRSGIVLSAECLTDVGDITEQSTKSTLLAGFQVACDIGVGVGLGDLPFDLTTEGDIQPTGNAKPCRVTQLFV